MAVGIAFLGSVLGGGVHLEHAERCPAVARESIGAAFELGCTEPAKTAFTRAVSVGAWVSAGFALAAALLGLVLLRTRPPAVERAEPMAVVVD